MAKKQESELKTEQSLEELLQEVEQIISGMEQQDVSLEQSFALYEKGMKQLQLCNEKIDRVEKKMQIMDEAGNLEDFR